MKTTIRKSKVSINRKQGLFVIPSGNGYTCLGFEVARDWTTKYAQWLGRPDLSPAAGRPSLALYAQYRAAVSAVIEKCTKEKTRCPVQLTPCLVGLEGRRVQVTTPDGEKRRFNVGKSTGVIPIHLEICNARSTGGCAAYVPQGSVVELIR